MNAQVTHQNQRADGIEQSLNEVLRRLVREVEAQANSFETKQSWSGDRVLDDRHLIAVMLEIEIDGICYQLLRRSPKSVHLVEETIPLSPREREVIRLVAKGYPNKTIAAILEISPWTVSTHLRRVFFKLGVNSRAEMIATVIQDGILS